MSAAIDTAVMTRLQGDATLATLAPGGAFPDVAPEGVADPFVIVSLSSHEDVDEQSGRTAFERPRYLVKAVGQGPNAAAAIAAYNRAHALLQGPVLTIVGFHCMDVSREERIRFVERDGHVTWHHVGGIYRVEADAA
jgi:Protein of unknown function (DUF3168)